MSSNRTIKPSSLSLSDLPWQIQWKKDRCTLCGQCTAVCPVRAIELSVFRKRNIAAINPSNLLNSSNSPKSYTSSDSLNSSNFDEPIESSESAKKNLFRKGDHIRKNTFSL